MSPGGGVAAATLRDVTSTGLSIFPASTPFITMRLAAHTSLPEPRRPQAAPRPSRMAYLAQLARVYARRSSVPLSFWREQPQLNERAFHDGRQYFVRYQRQATYRGPFDQNGVPLL